MTLDDYGTVGITIVPAAMEPAVMAVEINARTAEVVFSSLLLRGIKTNETQRRSWN
jgi:hypothetical protein